MKTKRRTYHEEVELTAYLHKKKKKNYKFNMDAWRREAMRTKMESEIVK